MFFCGGCCPNSEASVLICRVECPNSKAIDKLPGFSPPYFRKSNVKEVPMKLRLRMPLSGKFSSEN
jgi:hypothetical protein